LSYGSFLFLGGKGKKKIRKKIKFFHK